MAMVKPRAGFKAINFLLFIISKSKKLGEASLELTPDNSPIPKSNTSGRSTCENKQKAKKIVQSREQPWAPTTPIPCNKTNTIKWLFRQMKRVPQTQFGSKRKQNEMRDHEKSSCVDGKKRKKNTTRCTDKAHAAVSGSSFVNFDKNCHRVDSADNCGDYAVLNGRVPFVGLKMSHLDEYSIGFFDGDDQTTNRQLAEDIELWKTR
jgi:hypothetical protein